MTESDVQRRITQAFINTRPVSVSLQPTQRVKTSSGGYRMDRTAPQRSEQVFRLIEESAPRFAAVTEDGRQRDQYFILLGAWDAVMAVGDTFTLDGDDWTIDELYPDNGWERRARVIRHAQP